ncbi:PBECR4 domain-containing protein [Clostridium perfringens]|uniref:PBECR4 domain-containing protein n=1 Tax=Clostridium perfringens TaxID=1502 RepID=UPI0022461FC8|nr:PBECR4 domain-containing protein [Clostridium perfringens]MCX0354099.1 PBECR4 domain-containing protein [Clostridium perfringens]MDM0915841.1 PBECR4 domain-containing protein [Clostridium perfringens]
MWTVDSLREIEKPIKLEDLNLKLYAKFFQKHLSNRKYFIELQNGQILNFTIRDEHFPHLIALHYFIDKSNENFKLHKISELKKNKGFNNLINGDIELKDLLSVYTGKGKNRKKVFKNYKERILGFPFAYQMLRKSGLFVFKPKKKTTIKGDYLFARDIEGSKYHFIFINDSGVKEDNYVPITFITTKPKDFNFFNPEESIKVNKITIKNLLDNTTEEYIFENIDFTIEVQQEVAQTSIEKENDDK